MGFNFGKALGAGLQEAGAQLSKYGADQKEEERYQEGLAIKKERHEKEMQGMELRNMQLTMANNLKKVELQNQRITAIYTQTKGAAGPVSDAISEYGSGYKEQHDEILSRQATKEAGGKEMIVTHNGVWDTKPDGSLKLDENGKKIFKRLEGKAGTITRTRPEYDDHVAMVLNPSDALGKISSNLSQQKLYNQAIAQGKAQAKLQEEKNKTPMGKAKLEEQQAKTKIAKHKAENIGAPVKGESEVQSIRGNKVQRTHSETQGDIASMKLMAASNPDWGITSRDQAYRINELQNDPDLRNALADDLQKAIQEPDSGYGDKLVNEGAKKLGVPKQFLRKLLEEAMQDQESTEGSGGIKGWLKDFFKGTGEKAPSAFDDKKPGGLS